MNIEDIKKHFAKKYKFLGLLGKGGFAEVYLAMDIILERKVAIKILLTEHSNEPEMVKRFLREARLYAKLEHKNLISIYDTGIVGENAYIVMKYIKGKSLKHYIGSDKKTRDTILQPLIKNMGNVLSYIHKNGIIHRDIKPANILIEDSTYRIYLADFGIARSISSKTLTQSGSIMGTPYYISPEQIKGTKVDFRADIYALGATLYEFISGKPVFTAESSIEVLYKHVNDNPEPIGKIAPGLSKEVKYIISKCLEKNPEKRFGDASEIASLMDGRKSQKITKYLESVESKNKKGKKIFSAFAVIVITALLIFYFGIQKKSSELKTDKKENLSNSKLKNSITKKPKHEKIQNSLKNKKEAIKKSDNVLKKSSIFADKKEDIPTTKNKKKQDENNTKVLKNPEEKKSFSPVKTEKKLKIKDDSPMNIPAKILFSSFPPSDVYWNGIKLGNTTQVFSKKFPPGIYNFTFKIPGYDSGTKTVEISSGKKANVHYKFKPFGFLTLTAKPFAKFIINGKDCGSNPIFKKKFPTGTYRIQAVKPGYKTKEKTVEIKSMKKSFVSFIMQKEEKNEN